MQKAAPYEALKVLLDADAVTCNDGSSNLDAHLTQITVPIFYISAAGGFGSSGLYTMSLLASSDKTSLIESVTPGDDLHDYGHSDIWLGQNAQSLWWQPSQSWIQGHEPVHNCKAASDCEMVRDNDTCRCLGVPTGTPPPKSNSQCVVDPCRDQQPVCGIDDICSTISTSEIDI